MEQQRLGNSDLDVSVLGYGRLGLDANDGPAADRQRELRSSCRRRTVKICSIRSLAQRSRLTRPSWHEDNPPS